MVLLNASHGMWHKMNDNSWIVENVFGSRCSGVMVYMYPFAMDGNSFSSSVWKTEYLGWTKPRQKVRVEVKRVAKDREVYGIIFTGRGTFIHCIIWFRYAHMVNGWRVYGRPDDEQGEHGE